jgi:hypothetical protein
MNYKPDIFYKVGHLSLIQKSIIIHYAKLGAIDWWVDKLDCSESWARQRIDMSFNEIMKKLDEKCHFVIIHRRGYLDDKDKELWKWKGEVGFTTMGLGVEYYLWIHINEDYLKEMIEEFDLEVHD